MEFLDYIKMPLYTLRLAHDLLTQGSTISAMFHPGPTLGDPKKWVLHLFFSKRDFIKYD